MGSTFEVEVVRFPEPLVLSFQSSRGLAQLVEQRTPNP